MAVRRYFSPVAEIRAEFRKQDAVTIWIWFPLQPSHKIVESADEIVENTMVTGSSIQVALLGSYGLSCDAHTERAPQAQSGVELTPEQNHNQDDDSK